MNLRQAAQRALKAMEDGEDRADMIEFSDALIALRAALAEPEQEPYTWRKVTYDQLMEEVRNRGHEIRNAKITAPTPRKPLTDDDLDALRQDALGLNFVTLREFRVIARAIERAHGIGEQK